MPISSSGCRARSTAPPPTCWSGARRWECLGGLFGGATSNQAQGVWSSRDAGLINETIHIIRSYVTQADLDRLLPAVLAYKEQIKLELKQEAMALEVNQKLLIV